MKDRAVLGLDIGGTRCKMGLVYPARGRVEGLRVFPTETRDESLFFGRLRREFDELARLDAPVAAGVGICTYVFEGGVIDTTWGSVPILDHAPLAERLAGLFGVPCGACNDADAIARAEAIYGAGRGFARVLTLTLGTGIGVGFTVGGLPQNKDAAIHLAGHVRVRAGGEMGGCLDEQRCYCAVEGCLESTCSGAALGRMAAHLLGEPIENPALFARARAGDAPAEACVRAYLDFLACGLNQYAYLFCPDCVVLGGGVANGLAPWLSYLQHRLTAQVHTNHRPKLALAALREEGGVLGAALASPG